MTAVRRERAFSPEDVASINRAFEQALDILGHQASDASIRAKLVDALLALAHRGETDAERLCALAIVQTLGRKPNAAAEISGDRTSAASLSPHK